MTASTGTSMLSRLKGMVESPRLRLAVTTILTVAISVVASVYAGQITPNGVLKWALLTKVPSFQLLLGVGLLWFCVQWLYLKYDENLIRFIDDQHCLAFIRKTKLEAYADYVKSHPELALADDALTIMKGLKGKSR